MRRAVQSQQLNRHSIQSWRCAEEKRRWGTPASVLLRGPGHAFHVSDGYQILLLLNVRATFFGFCFYPVAFRLISKQKFNLVRKVHLSPFSSSSPPPPPTPPNVGCFSRPLKQIAFKEEECPQFWQRCSQWLGKKKYIETLEINVPDICLLLIGIFGIFLLKKNKEKKRPTWTFVLQNSRRIYHDTIWLDDTSLDHLHT